jgi:hypothetical protein
MLKILVACTVACFISTSANLAVAAEVATPKAASASLQKVNFTAQKSVYNQLNRVSTPARIGVMNPQSNVPGDLKVMPQSAQLVLLSTALLCFVVRASRRKV